MMSDELARELQLFFTATRAIRNCYIDVELDSGLPTAIIFRTPAAIAGRRLRLRGVSDGEFESALEGLVQAAGVTRWVDA
jgi:hypothetical protein